MKQLLALICATLALGLVAAGCGGDDDSGGDGGAAATTETTEQTATTDEQPSGGADAPAEQVEIEVVDNDYDPREETIPAGATVKWTNTGDLPHTVTKEGGPGEDFDSGTLQPGDSYEQTFDAPGEIDYLCTIHAGQDGSLTVR